MSRSVSPTSAEALAPAGGMRHTLQKLAAPIKISSTSPTDPTADWGDYIKKQDNPTYVNPEALRKQEEKLRERQEKKAVKEAARAAFKRDREGLSNASLFATNYSGMIHRDELDHDDENGLSLDIRVENLSVA